MSRNSKANGDIGALDQYDKTIFQIKQARDKVKAYIKKMEEKSNNQRSMAKSSLKQGNKDKAKLHLARSKAFETQVDVGQGQLNLLEEQIIQIDQTKLQNNALKVLEQGNKVLKALQAEISIEKWEQISEDMEEVRNQHTEISDFLKNHNSSNFNYEECINEELDQLFKLEAKSTAEKLPVLEPINKEVLTDEMSPKKKELILS